MSSVLHMLKNEFITKYVINGYKFINIVSTNIFFFNSVKTNITLKSTATCTCMSWSIRKCIVLNLSNLELHEIRKRSFIQHPAKLFYIMPCLFSCATNSLSSTDKNFNNEYFTFSSIVIKMRLFFICELIRRV